MYAVVEALISRVKQCIGEPLLTQTREIQRGAQSAFGLAFGTLRHLRTLASLRLSCGLARRGDLFLLAGHLGFGLVTRRGLSGRRHVDLLDVSN